MLNTPWTTWKKNAYDKICARKYLTLSLAVWTHCNTVGSRAKRFVCVCVSPAFIHTYHTGREVVKTLRGGATGVFRNESERKLYYIFFRCRPKWPKTPLADCAHNVYADIKYAWLLFRPQYTHGGLFPRADTEYFTIDPPYPRQPDVQPAKICSRHKIVFPPTDCTGSGAELLHYSPWRFPK